MKVWEMIELLKKQPQFLDVVCPVCSEYAMPDEGDIQIVTACEPREDGWVANPRSDKPQREYVVIRA